MKTTSIRHLPKTGFSLVETLMTISIISTAALSTLGLLAGSMSASQDGDLRSKALVVAQDMFHDLQLGALDLTPAPTDQRQTKVMRPLGTPIIPRQVFLYSQTGLLPGHDKLSKSTLTKCYEKGTTRPKVTWLVSIEGQTSDDFLPPPPDETEKGRGQVMSLPLATETSPLGDIAYDFPTVSAAVSPTAALPAAVGVLSQVRITVESPPTAPKERRKKYSYDFYWNP